MPGIQNSRPSYRIRARCLKTALFLSRVRKCAFKQLHRPTAKIRSFPWFLPFNILEDLKVEELNLA